MKTLVAAAEPDPFQWGAIVGAARPLSSTGSSIVLSSFEDYPTTATTIAWSTEILDSGEVAGW